ncbi:MAG TPA: geranylgeranylglyceryl/heptaprenylglyceryl phosphate synthase, partial [Flavobacteriales bacterium]|nr:geranylgeranylglyceryl/heptaprenylglyceryl phosphate synthase [Flavobacteriales bacterium]
MNNSWLEGLEVDRLVGRKRFAVLLDPDKTPKGDALDKWIQEIDDSNASDIFVGGSHLSYGNTAEIVERVKNITQLPVIIFPGSPDQICEDADALLLLSLVSGRNADLLIGKHVEAAPKLMAMNLETVAT